MKGNQFVVYVCFFFSAHILFKEQDISNDLKIVNEQIILFPINTDRWPVVLVNKSLFLLKLVSNYDLCFAIIYRKNK